MRIRSSKARLHGRGTTFGSLVAPPPIVPHQRGLLALRPTAPKGTGGQCPRPAPRARAWRGRGGARSDYGVTPRQACPRPDGLGRNLRSKTQWFAGFCNSHHVSHFATFFIDARAEISVAESHSIKSKNYGATGTKSRPPACLVILGAHRAGGLVGRPHRKGRDCVGSRRAQPDDGC